MRADAKREDPTKSATGRENSGIPQGFRTGIITAITVLLGFSLAFIRFWSFEAPGKWTLRSAIATCTLLVPVGLQIYTLFRSLRLEDDAPSEYRRTVIWLIVSALALLLGLLVAIVEF